MISRRAVMLSWAVAITVSGMAGAWIATDGLGGIEVAQPVAAPIPLAAKAVPAVQFSTPEAAIAEVLGRSAFDEGRRQFQRGPVEPPPPPPQPPRLFGVSSKEGVRSALVEWRPSGETQRLTVGMETQQGVVSRIGDSDLVLKAGDIEVVVSMFD
jgi:hypothetical protein